MVGAPSVACVCSSCPDWGGRHEPVPCPEGSRILNAGTAALHGDASGISSSAVSVLARSSVPSFLCLLLTEVHVFLSSSSCTGSPPQGTPAHRPTRRPAVGTSLFQQKPGRRGALQHANPKKTIRSGPPQSRRNPPPATVLLAACTPGLRSSPRGPRRDGPPARSTGPQRQRGLAPLRPSPDLPRSTT